MKKIIILLIAAMAVIVAAGASAGSAGLITSAQIKNRTIQFVDISPNAAHALRGQRGALGLNGSQGITGVNGANGLNGPKGDKGDTGAAGTASTVPGPKGDTGSAGPPGAPGNSPLVFGPYQSGSLDSSACGGDWANDTYTRTYIVAPQSDGSFQVTELFNGSFVTLAGNSPGKPCATIDAGITGQFYGDYVLTVPVKTQGTPAYFNFNFNATPSTNVTTGVFFNAVFHQAPPANYAWQFHYVTTNHGTWDNTDTGNAGNIN
jgi:hypothetical protein